MIHRFICTIFILIIGFVSFATYANADPILPGEKCADLPKNHKWLESETWAWRQICRGNVADFNRKLKKSLRSDKKNGWSNNRKISDRFLKTLLQYKTFRDAIPRQGIRFSGAYFTDYIDFNSALFKNRIYIRGSRFLNSLNFRNATFEKDIIVATSYFRSTVSLRSAKLQGNLTLERGNIFKETFDISDAEILGNVQISSTTFTKRAYFNGSRIHGKFYAGIGAKFSDQVSFIGAKISGDVNLFNATFNKKVEMSSIELGGHMFGNKSTVFADTLNMNSSSIAKSLVMSRVNFKKDLSLHFTKIGGQVFLRRAKFGGRLLIKNSEIAGNGYFGSLQATSFVNMDGSKFGRDVIFRDGNFQQEISINYAEIGQNLILSGATLHDLHLAGSTIGGELRLGRNKAPGPIWRKNSTLTLTNTRVAAIQDNFDEKQWANKRALSAWPAHLHLDGFSFGTLGGHKGTGRDNMFKRGSDWFIAWLSLDKSYAPQSYTNLASSIEAAGHDEIANDIRFENRERKRQIAWQSGRRLEWLGLTLLKHAIGYGLGFRYLKALIWVAVLIVIGAAFLRLSGEGPRNKMPYGFAYSLDHLLPIIELRRYHYDQVTLHGITRYYFFLHKMMGYVLASFLIAGLSGLTQT